MEYTSFKSLAPDWWLVGLHRYDSLDEPPLLGKHYAYAMCFARRCNFSMNFIQPFSLFLERCAEYIESIQRCKLSVHFLQRYNVFCATF
jgi:hypothetical protein